MSHKSSPDSLFEQIKDQEFPPVHLWDPPYCGEIPICIHSDGHWSYNDSVISRPALVKLFSKVLKREQDDYFLVTPVEKVKIRVETEPFVTVAVERTSTDPATLIFKTNLDEIVTADADHPILVSEDDKGQPYPRIHIRNQLHALISRSDYYQLIELALAQPIESQPDNADQKHCYIESCGEQFSLGKF